MRRAFDLGGLYIEEEMDTSYTVYEEKQEMKEIEEVEQKEPQKVVAPNAYITRLHSNIQAFAKNTGRKKKILKNISRKRLGS